uniref:Inner centromere protein ARK-binding domain-containing protein n=1 Tax=Clastoptera arizonana TaxID=38151 RepID=A0A1B6DLZ1_9HEMI
MLKILTMEEVNEDLKKWYLNNLSSGFNVISRHFDNRENKLKRLRDFFDPDKIADEVQPKNRNKVLNKKNSMLVSKSTRKTRKTRNKVYQDSVEAPADIDSDASTTTTSTRRSAAQAARMKNKSYLTSTLRDKLRRPSNFNSTAIKKRQTEGFESPKFATKYRRTAKEQSAGNSYFTRNGSIVSSDQNSGKNNDKNSSIIISSSNNNFISNESNKTLEQLNTNPVVVLLPINEHSDSGISEVSSNTHLLRHDQKRDKSPNNEEFSKRTHIKTKTQAVDKNYKNDEIVKQKSNDVEVTEVAVLKVNRTKVINKRHKPITESDVESDKGMETDYLKDNIVNNHSNDEEVTQVVKVNRTKVIKKRHKSITAPDDESDKKMETDNLQDNIAKNQSNNVEVTEVAVLKVNKTRIIKKKPEPITGPDVESDKETETDPTKKAFKNNQSFDIFDAELDVIEKPNLKTDTSEKCKENHCKTFPKSDLVKTRVKEFEEITNNCAGGMVTRTKKRAQAAAAAANTHKGDCLNGFSTEDEYKQNKGSKHICIQKVQSNEDEFKKPNAKQQITAEDAKKKKEQTLKATVDEKRKKREEKFKNAAALREAAEKEKTALALKHEKEKEEKAKHILLEREKAKEEATKKKMIAQQKALEAIERRKQEEAVRLAKLKESEDEHKRLLAIKEKEQEAAEKLLQKRKLEELRAKEAEKKIKIPVLKLHKVALTNATNTIKTPKSNTGKECNYEMTPDRTERPLLQPKNENDYGLDHATSDASSEDEGKPKKRIPQWALAINRSKVLHVQKYIPMSAWTKFMHNNRNPKLEDLFNPSQMPTRKRIRTSSAVWNSPIQL